MKLLLFPSPSSFLEGELSYPLSWEAEVPHWRVNLEHDEIPGVQSYGVVRWKIPPFPHWRFPSPFVELGQLPPGVVLKRILRHEALPAHSQRREHLHPLQAQVSAMRTSLLRALVRLKATAFHLLSQELDPVKSMKVREPLDPCVPRSTSIRTDVLNTKHGCTHSGVRIDFF